MQNIERTFKNLRSYQQYGLVFNALSLLMLFTLSSFHDSTGNGMMFFSVGFVLSIAYTVMTWGREGRMLIVSHKYSALLLALWLTSCFMLNYFMSVFDGLVWWVYALMYANLLTIWMDGNLKLPKWGRGALMFINGVSSVLMLYMTVYLLPIMPVGLVTILVLGVGIHTFIPVFILINNINWVRSKMGESLLPFVGGVAFAFLAILFTALMLNDSKNQIEQCIVKDHFSHGETELPVWVKVAQRTSGGYFMETYLKRGLTYQVFDENFFYMDRRLMNFGSSVDGFKPEHNPLIQLASLTVKEPHINEDERIRILESFRDAKFSNERRLWRGDKLFASQIMTDVMLYPKEGLAYTEKTIEIGNDTWGQGEAIFLFQLPEGTAVSSLSLWVNGVEEKGVLTSKSKASSAYNNIVGVERRDPAWVEWREGNTVAVRVFPVISPHLRKVKIGFTSPLRQVGDKMFYDNVTFRGPDDYQAKEYIQVKGMQGDVKFPRGFKQEGDRRFYQGSKLDKWAVEMPFNITPSAFVWEGKAYTLEKLKIEGSPFAPNKIVLDLTDDWTSDQVKKWVNGKAVPVVAFHHEAERQIKANDDFDELLGDRFSLMPIHRLPAGCLVVTKGGGIHSPVVSDLSGSPLSENLSDYAKTKPQPIPILYIGDAPLSPYWKALAEKRLVDIHRCGFDEAQRLVNGNVFPRKILPENGVAIPRAGITINQMTANQANVEAGHDHIYRLWAYNTVLSELRGQSADSINITDSLLAIAEDANVVTPVSSLIVLETQQDYDNQNIQKNTNTLGNASLKNNGAVPEPHEWALIGLAALAFIFWFRFVKN